MPGWPEEGRRREQAAGGGGERPRRGSSSRFGAGSGRGAPVGREEARCGLGLGGRGLEGEGSTVSCPWRAAVSPASSARDRGNVGGDGAGRTGGARQRAAARAGPAPRPWRRTRGRRRGEFGHGSAQLVCVCVDGSGEDEAYTEKISRPMNSARLVLMIMLSSRLILI